MPDDSDAVAVLHAIMESHLVAARSLETAIDRLRRRESREGGPEPATASATAATASWTLPEPVLLDTREAAARLGMSPRTLEKMRVHGGGPPFVRFGGSVRYPVGELDAWIAAHQRFASTSDADRTVTVGDACDLLDMPYLDFLALAKRRKIPLIDTGPKPRIKRSDIDRLLNPEAP